MSKSQDKDQGAHQGRTINTGKKPSWEAGDAINVAFVPCAGLFQGQIYECNAWLPSQTAANVLRVKTHHHHRGKPQLLTMWPASHQAGSRPRVAKGQRKQHRTALKASELKEDSQQCLQGAPRPAETRCGKREAGSLPNWAGGSLHFQGFPPYGHGANQPFGPQQDSEGFQTLRQKETRPLEESNSPGHWALRQLPKGPFLSFAAFAFLLQHRGKLPESNPTASSTNHSPGNRPSSAEELLPKGKEGLLQLWPKMPPHGCPPFSACQDWERILL